MSEPLKQAAMEPGTAESGAGVDTEVAAVDWIFESVSAGRPVPVAEAESVVNSMFAEQQWGGRPVFPLIPVSEPSAFLAVHSVNVARLAMTLAGSQQFDPAAIRSVGLAALLHDIGMVTVDAGAWRKAGELTPAERASVKRHTVDGARLLLAAHASLDLAAVVAYEHHLTMDGSGYPTLLYPRPTHFVSRLVQVCDVFCALSTDRPYRKPWPPEVIVSFLKERSGFEFHPTLASALVALVQSDLTAGPVL